MFDNAPDLAKPSEVYAIGFRNPWRASFDKDGRLFVGDVGDRTAEEINLAAPGANYGWGRQDNGTAPDDGPTPGENDGYTDAIHSYFRTEGIGTSVTGGYVYNGPIAALRGKYVFGDYTSGKIWTLEQTGTGWLKTDITSMIVPSAGTINSIASFGTDKNGNLYVVDVTGEVFRLDAGNGGTDLGDTLAGGGGNDIIYGGGGNDTIHGDADNDHLYGEADDDRLYGDDGADTIEGGTGNDVYYVDSDDIIVEKADEGTNDRILALESFVLQAGQEIEEIAAADPSSETALNLTGNEFDQRIIGNAGDNVLNGFTGEDTLIGGAGNDTYIVHGGDDEIQGEDANSGTADQVISAATYTLDAFIERLTLGGTAAINGTGNGLNNEIVGNSAANTLDGLDGLDTLRGGNGDDTYVLRDEDEVDEGLEGGTDTVESWLETYKLTANVENLKLMGSAVNGVGNELVNVVTGNGEANRLDGEAGNDVMHGNGGNDTIHGGDDNDHIYGDADNDSLYGDAGADTLNGGAGDDTYYVDTDDAIEGETVENGDHDAIKASGSFSLQDGQESRLSGPTMTTAPTRLT